MQDGKNQTVSSARKQSIAIALLDLKKGKKVMVEEDSPVSSRRSPTPKKKSKKKTHVSYSKKQCAGVEYKKLMAMSLKDLRKTVHSRGIKSGLPRSKQGIVDYLCAAEENGRCGPVAGKWCEGELICDVSNSPGVCVSPSQTDHHSMGTLDYQGKKIIGTIAAITALKKALKSSKQRKKKKTPVDKFRKRLDRMEIENRMDKKRAEADEKNTKRVMTDRFDELKKDDRKNKYSIRKLMIKTISDETGFTPNTFTYWNDEDLYNRYMQIMEMEKNQEQTPRYGQLTPVVDAETSSDENKYAEQTPRRRHSQLTSVVDDESSSEQSSDENKQEQTPRRRHSQLTSVVDDESSSEQSSDENKQEQTRHDRRRELVDDESSSEQSSDENEEEEITDYESSRPDEGVEIPDVESTLANVIAGGSNIGEVANVQRSILKCLGLMSK